MEKGLDLIEPAEAIGSVSIVIDLKLEIYAQWLIRMNTLILFQHKKVQLTNPYKETGSMTLYLPKPFFSGVPCISAEFSETLTLSCNLIGLRSSPSHFQSSLAINLHLHLEQFSLWGSKSQQRWLWQAWSRQC